MIEIDHSLNVIPHHERSADHGADLLKNDALAVQQRRVHRSVGAEERDTVLNDFARDRAAHGAIAVARFDCARLRAVGQPEAIAGVLTFQNQHPVRRAHFEKKRPNLLVHLVQRQRSLERLAEFEHQPQDSSFLLKRLELGSG